MRIFREIKIDRPEDDSSVGKNEEGNGYFPFRDKKIPARRNLFNRNVYRKMGIPYGYVTQIILNVWMPFIDLESFAGNYDLYDILPPGESEYKEVITIPSNFISEFVNWLPNDYPDNILAQDLLASYGNIFYYGVYVHHLGDLELWTTHPLAIKKYA